MRHLLEKSWTDNVDAYLRNVKGIECTGDINVLGTFRINGVSIMAFKPVPERVIERIIEPRIIERAVLGADLEAGDNITIERSGDTQRINSDPGDWQEFVPKVIGVRAKIATGQYIVYGPICFVQMYLEPSQHMDTPVKVYLPFAARGPVPQSLNVGVIEKEYVALVPEDKTYINGAYRIA